MMAGKDPWWLRRPTTRAALGWGAGCLALAALLAAAAGSRSPLAARAALPLQRADVREVFLSSDARDPGRVLLTTRRGLTTLARDTAALGGRRYWIRRYGDPQQPGIPKRRLLSSRTRGARLYLPIAAVDLERALAHGPAGGLPVRSEWVFLYEDRLFRGLFLELRFPKRERGADGDWQRFDLVAVRGSEVRTVDWVLQSHARYYRERIALGRRPASPEWSLAGEAGVELAFALYEQVELPVRALWLPISLFDELSLAWPDALPRLVDDRWRPEAVSPAPVEPPGADDRARARELLAIHREARFETPSEARLLALRAAQLARM